MKDEVPIAQSALPLHIVKVGFNVRFAISQPPPIPASHLLTNVRYERFRGATRLQSLVCFELSAFGTLLKGCKTVLWSESMLESNFCYWVFACMTNDINGRGKPPKTINDEILTKLHYLRTPFSTINI